MSEDLVTTAHEKIQEAEILILDFLRANTNTKDLREAYKDKLFDCLKMIQQIKEKL